MKWEDVGNWLMTNAGSGAALVGSLLVGNVPGAIAAGVSLVGSATGHATPDEAMIAFQNDPATVTKLRELALQDEAGIREHVRAMTELQLKDSQAEQEQTQLTIRSGDNSDDVFVRRTRPGQSWVSLLAALAYVGYGAVTGKAVDGYVLAALLTLPWAYAGLRQIGKGVDVWAAAKVALKAKGGAA